MEAIEPAFPRRAEPAFGDEPATGQSSGSADTVHWSMERHGALLLIAVRNDDAVEGPVLGGPPLCDHVGINVHDSMIHWQDLAQAPAETRPRPGSTLILPRQLLEPHLARLSLNHNDKFPGSSSAAQFITHLLDLLPHVPAGKVRAITGSVRGFLAYLLEEHVRNQVTDPVGSSWSRIIAYIDDNLADPDLNSASICRSIGISRSTLYRHFDMVDGVAQYIQLRRVRLAHHLIRATPPAVPIVQIAERTGFSSPGVFWRTFKRAYGTPPGAIPRSVDFDHISPISENARLPVELHRMYRASTIYLDTPVSLEMVESI